jgi:NitT/TauT family transport system ATP-binding protein
MTQQIVFDNVSKTFLHNKLEKIGVLDSFSLKITFSESVQTVAICGPSGCGKSTLLNLVAGIEKIDDGNLGVSVQGNPINQTDMAMVAQHNSCFPWMTAIQNVEFGLRIQGKSKESRKIIAKNLLQELGLLDRIDSYPGELSGGMLQRVSLARALAPNPKLLLLDEPFTALDPDTKREAQLQMMAAISKHSIGTLLVTHDLTEALLLADRIILLPFRPIHFVHYDFLVPFVKPRSPCIVYEHSFIDTLRALNEKMVSAKHESQSLAK